MRFLAIRSTLDKHFLNSSSNHNVGFRVTIVGAFAKNAVLLIFYSQIMALFSATSELFLVLKHSTGCTFL